MHHKQAGAPVLDSWCPMHSTAVRWLRQMVADTICQHAVRDGLWLCKELCCTVNLCVILGIPNLQHTAVLQNSPVTSFCCAHHQHPLTSSTVVYTGSMSLLASMAGRS